MAKKTSSENREKSLDGEKAVALVEETAAAPANDAPKRGATRKTLVKEAYKRVGLKLKNASDPTEAIDDLVKLAKIEKDMGEEGEPGVGEVRVRWVQSEKDESSKEP